MTRLLIVLMVLWAAPAWATTYTCTNGQFVASADVNLVTSDVINFVGTAGARCTVLMKGFKIGVDGGGGFTGSITLDYVDMFDCGSSTLQCIGVNGGVEGYAYLNGATLNIQHSTCRRCGAWVNAFSAGAAVVTFNYNTYYNDNVVPAGGSASEAKSMFTEQGSSTTTKNFRGNRIYRAAVSLASPNWIVGAANGCTTTCNSDGNLMQGYRVGLAVSGTGCYVAYNFINPILDVWPANTFWSQVGNGGPFSSSCVIENNLFIGGHWVISGNDGEFRKNVACEAHGHDYMRNGTGALNHDNIFCGVYLGGEQYNGTINHILLPAAITLNSSGQSGSYYNNTFDVRGVAGAQGPNTLLWVVSGATVTTFRSSLVYGLTVGNSGCGPNPAPSTCQSALGLSPSEGYTTPLPNRALELDFNDIRFDAGSSRKVVFAIGVSGLTKCVSTGFGANDLGTCDGQGVDPLFRGTLPIGSAFDGSTQSIPGFPIAPQDIFTGRWTQSEILTYFRWVYAPQAGSPLLGEGKAGVDIGAVQIADVPGAEPAIHSTNKAPRVSCGPSFAIANTGTTAILHGWAIDDGKPSGTLTYSWTMLNGPGAMTFGTASQSSTTAASWTASGVYTLRLTARDGSLSAFSDCTITVG